MVRLLSEVTAVHALSDAVDVYDDSTSRYTCFEQWHLQAHSHLHKEPFQCHHQIHLRVVCVCDSLELPVQRSPRAIAAGV